MEMGSTGDGCPCRAAPLQPCFPPAPLSSRAELSCEQAGAAGEGRPVLVASHPHSWPGCWSLVWPEKQVSHWTGTGSGACSMGWGHAPSSKAGHAPGYPTKPREDLAKSHRPAAPFSAAAFGLHGDSPSPQCRNRGRSIPPSRRAGRFVGPGRSEAAPSTHWQQPACRTRTCGSRDEQIPAWSRGVP